jgi:Family of unknown function (DUF5681)
MRNTGRKPGVTYEIGYAKPPVSTRFQAGQSGNPSGRPKGARNASSMAHDALERPVTIKVKQTSRKMTVRKAAYLRLAERAVAGDIKSLAFLLSLESKERPAESDHADGERSAAKDLEILQDFFDRRRAGLPEDKAGNGADRAIAKTKRGTP